MIPFRVFDRDKKAMWIVLNYHAGDSNGGSYLLAREDDSENDGELKIVPANSMAGFRLVDFLDEAED
jgi:hypothetical protein